MKFKSIYEAIINVYTKKYFDDYLRNYFTKYKDQFIVISSENKFLRFKLISLGKNYDEDESPIEWFIIDTHLLSKSDLSLANAGKLNEITFDNVDLKICLRLNQDLLYGFRTESTAENTISIRNLNEIYRVCYSFFCEKYKINALKYLPSKLNFNLNYDIELKMVESILKRIK